MISIENPWLKLSPFADSYVLEIDRACIQRHNCESRSEKNKFIIESIPEPFIGYPESARVILLGKNPGHSDDDVKSHRNAEFQKAMFHNLRHEAQEYPFYPLNPAFSETGAGRWWRTHTRELRSECGLDDQTIARRLMVIEWFPYHSRSFVRPKTECESQKYSFQLAKLMLEKSFLIVRMRAKKEWTEVDQRFGSARSLKNPQRSFISRGNTGEWFDEIVEALRDHS